MIVYSIYVPERRGAGRQSESDHKRARAMSLVQVLPLAIVMIAGPQILSPIFLATSEKWRANSTAYVFGAALSISLVVVVAYLLGNSLGGGGGGLLGASAKQLLHVVVLVLLLYAAVDTYRKRNMAEPPAWMGS